MVTSGPARKVHHARPAMARQERLTHDARWEIVENAARELKDRGLGDGLLGERAIEVHRRAGKSAQPRALDAPPVGEVGFERIERTGDRKDAIVVERERAFEDEVPRRRREVIVVAFEPDGRGFAALRRLLDAHVGRRAEKRDGVSAAGEHVCREGRARTCSSCC